MIDYSLSCPSPTSQILNVVMSFEHQSNEHSIYLNLPAWRPGRYEFQHFARNLFGLKAFDATGKVLLVQKSARNEWRISNVSKGKIHIEYHYSCTQLDAGGSWIDDELIYINPINCLLYLKENLSEACSLNITKLSDKTPASALFFKDHIASCSNYYELADSPFFLSSQQTHDNYDVEGHNFHIWTHGNISYNQELLKQHFEGFTKAQMDAMQNFPEKTYHFLLLLFPFRCYHGVEHKNSTVITLGPSQELAEDHLYNELVSISSHELYHAWNICKIRPQEMLPYNFDKENYFRTGFIAEGVTSYLGEYFLLKSGFFSEEQFFQEINQWLARHQHQKGIERASLLESSFDLWVDGYTASAADYKVSIYVAGALSAIAMDLLIRLNNPSQSIHDFMRNLYNNVAQKGLGYTEQTIQDTFREFVGESDCQDFWSHCISGHNVVSYVSSLLETFGLVLENTPSEHRLERIFGIKLKSMHTKPEIGKIKLEAPAAKLLMADDLIIAIDGTHVSNGVGIEEQLIGKTQATFHVLRKSRELHLEVTADDKKYWQNLIVQKNSEASDEEKLRYKSWISSF